MTSRRVLLLTIPPAARASRLATVVATVGLAGVPLLVTLARGGTELSGAIVVLALGLGASLAWSADDDARELLAATPVGVPARSAVRLLIVSGVAGALGVALAGLGAVTAGLPTTWVDRMPEMAAAAAAGLAVAFGVARRDSKAGGVSGVMAGFLTPPAVVLVAMYWPTRMPAFETGPTHTRWWLIAAAGCVFALWAARDPARR